ncbi:MAG: HAD-IIB family hydrolase [Erysipelothrix sp.]|nr:HAD-IIB family hydrolase [Erysipelothrix sp.]
MKLFVSDYDGTLHIDGTVDQETLDAIDVFRAQGNLFGIATGRSLSSIKNQIEIYQIPVDFIISENGAIAVDGNDKQVYFHKMPFTRVQEIIADFPKDELLYYGVSDGVVVGVHDEFNNRTSTDTTIVDIDDVMMHEKLVGLYAKLDTHANAVQFTQFINHKYEGETCAFTWFQYVVILNCGVSKHSGIDEYRKAKNLDLKPYVIGDSFNDIPMVKGFDGFAICSGREEVKEWATMCFDNVGKALKYVMSQD